MAAATSAIFTLKLATGYTACASAGGFCKVSCHGNKVRLSQEGSETTVLYTVDITPGALRVGTSNAEDAMAVSNAQLKAQKVVQEFAIPRGSFLPALPAGIPGTMVLGPLGGPVGPGSAEQQMALVPVMLPNPDGSYMAAYQVQPVPLGTQGGPAEFTGGFMVSLLFPSEFSMGKLVVCISMHQPTISLTPYAKLGS